MWSIIKSEITLFRYFLLGDRERTLFSIWYFFILIIPFILMIPTYQQWTKIYPPEEYPVFMVILYIAGFIGLSTAYWLGIAILAFLRPGREFPLGGKHGPWKRFVAIINLGAFILFAVALFNPYFRQLFWGTIIVIGVALVTWSFLTTYFLLDALRGILYRFEEHVRNVPKLSDSIIKNLILLGIIDVILLFPILYITNLTVISLQGLFTGTINIFGLVLNESIFIGILVLLAEIFLIGSLNIVSLFVFFRYRQRHSSKFRYVPYMHTLVILYTFVFGIKFLLFDINPYVDIFDIIINSAILLVVVLLAIRKVAKWVGPIDLEDYVNRLNPRSLTLFFFTVSALQSILLRLVRFWGGVKTGELLFYGVQIFTFVFWAPLAYMLVFVVGDFPEEIEPEPPTPEEPEPEPPTPEESEGNQQTNTT